MSFLRNHQKVQAEKVVANSCPDNLRRLPIRYASTIALRITNAAPGTHRLDGCRDIYNKIQHIMETYEVTEWPLEDGFPSEYVDQKEFVTQLDTKTRPGLVFESTNPSSVTTNVLLRDGHVYVDPDGACQRLTRTAIMIEGWNEKQKPEQRLQVHWQLGKRCNNLTISARARLSTVLAPLAPASTSAGPRTRRETEDLGKTSTPVIVPPTAVAPVSSTPHIVTYKDTITRYLATNNMRISGLVFGYYDSRREIFDGQVGMVSTVDMDTLIRRSPIQFENYEIVFSPGVVLRPASPFTVVFTGFRGTDLNGFLQFILAALHQGEAAFRQAEGDRALRRTAVLSTLVNEGEEEYDESEVDCPEWCVTGPPEFIEGTADAVSISFSPYRAYEMILADLDPSGWCDLPRTVEEGNNSVLKTTEQIQRRTEARAQLAEQKRMTQQVVSADFRAVVKEEVSGRMKELDYKVSSMASDLSGVKTALGTLTTSLTDASAAIASITTAQLHMQQSLTLTQARQEVADARFSYEVANTRLERHQAKAILPGQDAAYAAKTELLEQELEAAQEAMQEALQLQKKARNPTKACLASAPPVARDRKRQRSTAPQEQDMDIDGEIIGGDNE